MKPMSSKTLSLPTRAWRPLSLRPWLEPQNMNQNRTVRHRSVRVPKTARARTHGGAASGDRGPTMFPITFASEHALFEKF